VLIREYTIADLDGLRHMHASQGFDYPFPDLSDPIFISKFVVEDDSGRPVMASLARLTCEMYLLIDREHEKRGQGSSGEGNSRSDNMAKFRSPAERWRQLLALHSAAERDLFARGLDDAHAWLPPQIARRFGRRLESLGWIRDDSWTPYCKRLITSR
jgi:hypothetical protein